MTTYGTAKVLGLNLNRTCFDSKRNYRGNCLCSKQWLSNKPKKVYHSNEPKINIVIQHDNCLPLFLCNCYVTRMKFRFQDMAVCGYPDLLIIGRCKEF